MMFQPPVSTTRAGRPISVKLVIDNSKVLTPIDVERALTDADFFDVPEPSARRNFVARLWESFGLAADAFYVGALTVEAWDTPIAEPQSTKREARNGCPIKRAFRYLMGTWRRRKVYLELSAMSDFQLRDIGVTRQALEAMRDKWLP
jgi:uncharacterized protein YjiS (DUF1127 family)